MNFELKKLHSTFSPIFVWLRKTSNVQAISRKTEDLQVPTDNLASKLTFYVVSVTILITQKRSSSIKSFWVRCLECFWSNSNALDQTRMILIIRFWKNAFNRTRLIAFVRMLLIYIIGCPRWSWIKSVWSKAFVQKRLHSFESIWVQSKALKVQSKALKVQSKACEFQQKSSSAIKSVRVPSKVFEFDPKHSIVIGCRTLLKKRFQSNAFDHSWSNAFDMYWMSALDWTRLI